MYYVYACLRHAAFSAARRGVGMSRAITAPATSEPVRGIPSSLAQFSGALDCNNARTTEYPTHGKQ